MLHREVTLRESLLRYIGYIIRPIRSTQKEEYRKHTSSHSATCNISPPAYFFLLLSPLPFPVIGITIRYVLYIRTPIPSQRRGCTNRKTIELSNRIYTIELPKAMLLTKVQVRQIIFLLTTYAFSHSYGFLLIRVRRAARFARFFDHMRSTLL